MLRSWQTTLIGIGGGILNLWASGISFKTAVVSGVLAGIGICAKDSNVTGGNR